MVNTYPDLVLGYSVIWGVLTLYIISLGFRLKKLERSLESKSDGK